MAKRQDPIVRMTAAIRILGFMAGLLSKLYQRKAELGIGAEIGGRGENRGWNNEDQRWKIDAAGRSLPALPLPARKIPTSNLLSSIFSPSPYLLVTLSLPLPRTHST